MGRRLIPGVDKISEDWVKKQVKERLDRFALKWDMPPATMYGNAGRHDFIICQQGYFWTIETKAGYNKPSSLQIGYADDIIDAGGHCYLINEFNYIRVTEIAAHFIYKNIVRSDDFRAYQGGKEYASKTWGISFSS